MTLKRLTRNLFVALLLAGAAGCATTTGSDPRDPLEPFNRAMYSFNDGFDQAIGKPIATAYHDVLPEPARMMIRNLFANVADLWIGANNLMQGKPLDAMTDWTRFAINSTFGLLGLMDFASDMGLEKHDEDLGQTMGRWGMDDGAYVVWPFIGPSTARDSVGLIPDLWIDPVWGIHPHSVRYAAAVLRAFSKRADLLDASRILEEAALDKYVFQRDAHLQRRKSLIYDGNPPREPRIFGSESEPRAQLDIHIAAEVPVATVVPETQPPAPALDAAAQLLEQPASPAPVSGG